MASGPGRSVTEYDPYASLRPTPTASYWDTHTPADAYWTYGAQMPYGTVPGLAQKMQAKQGAPTQEQIGTMFQNNPGLLGSYLMAMQRFPQYVDPAVEYNRQAQARAAATQANIAPVQASLQSMPAPMPMGQGYASMLFPRGAEPGVSTSGLPPEMVQAIPGYLRRS